jgi:hypothetical protein
MIEGDVTDEDYEDDEDEFDYEEPPLLAGGSFMVSASTIYPAAVRWSCLPFTAVNCVSSIITWLTALICATDICTLMINGCVSLLACLDR